MTVGDVNPLPGFLAGLVLTVAASFAHLAWRLTLTAWSLRPWKKKALQPKKSPS